MTSPAKKFGRGKKCTENATTEVVPIPLSSASELKTELEAIGTLLADTSALWNKRVDSLKRLRGILLGGGANFPNFVQLVKDNFRQSLSVQLKDLRSAVARETCSVIQAMCSTTQPGQWEQMSDWWLASLFKCTFVTIAVVAEGSNATLRFLIENGRLNPRATNCVLTNTQNKHNICRIRANEYLLLLLQVAGETFLEKYTDGIEQAIKAGVYDSIGEVRQCSRLSWWAYKEHFIAQAERLLATFDAQVQKLVTEEQATFQGLERAAPLSHSGSPNGKKAQAAHSRRLAQSSSPRAGSCVPSPIPPATNGTAPPSYQDTASTTSAASTPVSGSTTPTKASTPKAGGKKSGLGNKRGPTRSQSINSTLSKASVMSDTNSTSSSVAAAVHHQHSNGINTFGGASSTGSASPIPGGMAAYMQHTIEGAAGSDSVISATSTNSHVDDFLGIMPSRSMEADSIISTGNPTNTKHTTTTTGHLPPALDTPVADAVRPAAVPSVELTQQQVQMSGSPAQQQYLQQKLQRQQQHGPTQPASTTTTTAAAAPSEGGGSSSVVVDQQQKQIEQAQLHLQPGPIVQPHTPQRQPQSQIAPDQSQPSNSSSSLYQRHEVHTTNIHYEHTSPASSVMSSSPVPPHVPPHVNTLPPQQQHQQQQPQYHHANHHVQPQQHTITSTMSHNNTSQSHPSKRVAGYPPSTGNPTPTTTPNIEHIEEGSVQNAYYVDYRPSPSPSASVESNISSSRQQHPYTTAPISPNVNKSIHGGGGGTHHNGITSPTASSMQKQHTNVTKTPTATSRSNITSPVHSNSNTPKQTPQHSPGFTKTTVSQHVTHSPSTSSLSSTASHKSQQQQQQQQPQRHPSVTRMYDKQPNGRTTATNSPTAPTTTSQPTKQPPSGYSASNTTAGYHSNSHNHHPTTTNSAATGTYHNNNNNNNTSKNLSTDHTGHASINSSHSGPSSVSATGGGAYTGMSASEYRFSHYTYGHSYLNGSGSTVSFSDFLTVLQGNNATQKKEVLQKLATVINPNLHPKLKLQNFNLDTQFDQLFLPTVECTQNPDSMIATSAIIVCKLLVQQKPNLATRHITTLMTNLLQCCASDMKEVSQNADEALTEVVTHTDASECFDLLVHELNSSTGQIQIPIRLIGKLVSKVGERELERRIPLFIEALYEGFKHRNADVRKSVVFCLVDIYMVLKDKFNPWLKNLNTSQLKLVTIYINRQSQQKEDAPLGGLPTAAHIHAATGAVPHTTAPGSGGLSNNMSNMAPNYHSSVARDATGAKMN